MPTSPLRRRFVGFAATLASCLAVATTSSAQTTLFDFEDPALLKLVTPKTTSDRVECSAGFATSGLQSLEVATPVYIGGTGMQTHPSWTIQIPENQRDWSAYDRVSMDVANLMPTKQNLTITLHSGNNGVIKTITYHHPEPCSAQRIVLAFGKQNVPVDPRNVQAIELSTYAPGAQYQINLDNVRLLKSDEETGELSADTHAKMLERLLSSVYRPAVERVREAHAQATVKVDAMEKTSRLPVAGLRRLLDGVAQQLDVAQNLGEDPQTPMPELLAGANGMTGPEAEVTRVEELVKKMQQMSAGDLHDGTLLALAHPTEKLRPRAGMLNTKPLRTINMDLARGEEESVQVIMLPLAEDLTGVHVTVEGLDAASVVAEVDVVGYVRVTQTHLRDLQMGWWPDPLLNFLDTAEIRAGDAQSFWVRLKAAPDAEPGKVKATVRVSHAGGELAAVPLEAEIYNFSMPEHSPLPLALSINNWGLMNETKYDPTQEEKLDFVDILANYYVDYDKLYGKIAVDWDKIDHLQEQERTGVFNLAHLGEGELNMKPQMTEAEWAEVIPKVFDRIRDNYEQAKERGLLDHTYVYGFDEKRPLWVPTLNRLAGEIKKEFPGVKVMTTAHGDPSTGPNVDIWCPVTVEFRHENAVKARQQGKNVWWYIYYRPTRANMYVDGEGIGHRFLMGAATAKERPGGFLYYSVIRWQANEKPITEGPFTDWDPASYKDSNGDGSWFCAGPGAKPLPTVRIENFRDGLEDYAAVRVLEETVAAVQKKLVGGDAASNDRVESWIEQARTAALVPDQLLRSVESYSTNPDELDEWRRGIYHAIAASPMEPANPWPNGLNLDVQPDR